MPRESARPIVLITQLDADNRRYSLMPLASIMLGAMHHVGSGCSRSQRGVLAITKRGRERLCDWIEPGANLRFLYNAACDSGRKNDAWRASFAPAEVKTFDRLSLVVEHWHWAWFTAPRLIRGGEWPLALADAPDQLPAPTGR